VYLANDWGNKGLAALRVGAMRAFLLLGESHRAVCENMEVHCIIYISSGRNCDWGVAQRALGDDAVDCSRIIIVARVFLWFPMLLTETVVAVVALKGQEVDGVAG
jgi:L-rhamnose isomerase